MTDKSTPMPAIDVRLQISALWITVLMIFAYVDLFSLYRPDVRTGLDAGKVHIFDVAEGFLFFTTLYVTIPALMIFLSLVLSQRWNRIANFTLAGLYAVTIVGSAVGEWWYYMFGSGVEVVLLLIIMQRSWVWPRTL